MYITSVLKGTLQTIECLNVQRFGDHNLTCKFNCWTSDTAVGTPFKNPGYPVSERHHVTWPCDNKPAGKVSHTVGITACQLR